MNKIDTDMITIEIYRLLDLHGWRGFFLEGGGGYGLRESGFNTGDTTFDTEGFTMHFRIVCFMTCWLKLFLNDLYIFAFTNIGMKRFQLSTMSSVD